MSADMDNPVEEAMGYYHFVLEELNKRQVRLEKLEAQIKEQELKIKSKPSSKKSLFLGEIGGLLSDNSNRRELKDEKMKMLELHEEVKEEVVRALERLEIAKEELSDLGVKV